MGKTRGLFKKIRDTQGTFHEKMITIKDRNDMDLTEAKDIKKICQEYTEELYKKDLNDPEYHDGVITNLEPDILECEVKWALGSITTSKASGGDGIPAKLFQILKDDVKMLHSINMPANLENSAVATGLKKVSFHSNTKEGQYTSMQCTQLHLFHMLERLCSKFSKLDFNSMWTKSLQMYKLYLENAEEPQIKLPTSPGSQKKQENFRITSTSGSLTTLKPLTV